MCEDASASVAIHDLRERVARLEQAVYGGNGTTGIAERLAALENATNANTRLLRAVLGAVITSIVTAIATAIL